MAKGNAAKKAAEPEDHWPADSVQRVKIDKLVPYARNARTHSPQQVDQIAASMREWGWTIPVLCDEKGGIIAGHGRILAAKKNGYTTVPCMTAKGWSEAKKKAYVLADNKLALNAGWDPDMLKLEIQELKELDFDLDLIGFTTDELDVALGGWDSDIDPLEADGENLDGIAVTIKIIVDQDAGDQAKKLIAEALTKAGLTFELK